jgi:ABC-type uncharacterized transport system substrate-binding protein
VIGAAALLLCLAGAPAQPSRVVVIEDAPSKLVDEAVAGLIKDGKSVEVRALGAPLVDAADTFFLAAGPKSAQALASSTMQQRAAFLVKASDAPATLASVALDAPLSSQLQWVKLAFPGRARVIVPRSSGAADAALTNAAQAAGLALVLVDVKSPGEAVPAVMDALKKSGGPAVILLVPDPVAVTPDTVAPLVQSALADRAPVVGFSTYFLKVGALAAVATDAPDMARQALAATSPGAQAPKSGHLVVDGRLAERLGVSVHDGPGVEVRR